MSLKSKVIVMALDFGLLLLVVNAMAVAASSHLEGVENDKGLVKPKNDATECKASFVEVTQGAVGALPSGTPIFSVQILNQCPKNCKIAKLHLNCGSFTSEKLILPSIFKRVGDNDCLVNNGLPIGVGSVVSFKYANSQQFPLQVSSLQCLS